MLMIAGFDKYFQIAPCFRDEDARADRSPGEFYQLDIEMSFVTQEDVFAVVEPILYDLFTKFSKKKVSNYPFRRIKYDESMLKYGTDKPDLRNPIIIHDTTDIFTKSNFSIFKDSIKKGAIVRAIPAPSAATKSRKFFDDLIKFAIEHGAKGLAYIQFDNDGSAKGPIAKLLNQELLEEIKQKTEITNGDAIFFACAKVDEANKIAAIVRNKLGELLELIDDNKFEFCWIVDFPYFEFDNENNKLEFSHNPFSMPKGGDKVLETAKTIEELLAIKAYQYDIVCNGIELSSGAIRNHKLSILYKAFEMTGYDKEKVDKNFPAMVKALKYGTPPHGGIAPGVDRIVMLILSAINIREVIAFPMNQQGEDLLMEAPSTIDKRQLDELNLKQATVIKK